MSEYGIISGISEPEHLNFVMAFFDDLAIDTVILNGDLISQSKLNRIYDSKHISHHLNRVFEILGNENKTIIVQPGYYDQFVYFETAMHKAKNKYSNIVDAREYLHIPLDTHHLLFLPGVDNDESNYLFGNQQPSGFYEKRNNKWIQATKSDISSYTKYKEYHNLEELGNLITHPEKTILITPQPQRFSQNRSIDAILFHENIKTHKREVHLPFQNKDFWKNIEQIKKELRRTKFGIVNIGSTVLKKFVDKYNLTKIITSNQTINAQKSRTKKDNYCHPDKIHNDINYSTGRLEDGCAGMIFVNEKSEIFYKNVDIRPTINKMKNISLN